MSPLAQMLMMKVTPLKLWNPPKEYGDVRPSDVERKHNHAKRIEETYECLSKPMNAKQVAEYLGFTYDCAYKYLLGLYRDKRIHRSSKQPYIYWKL